MKEVVILRKGKDTDVFVKPSYIQNYLKNLEHKGYIVIPKYLTSGYTAIKYTKSKIKIYDIISSFDYIGYIFKIYPKVDIDKYLNDKYYRKKLDIVRYLLLLKNDKKSVNFLIKNKKQISESFETFFRNKDYPFRKKNLKDKDIKKILSKNIFYLFYLLKFKFFLYFVCSYFLFFIKLFNKGKIFVFLGPDGSGKSYLINKIKESNNHRFFTDYMWTKKIPLSKFFMNIPNVFFIKFFSFFLIYVLFLYKYFILLFNKLKGRFVLVERWPTYEFFIKYKLTKKHVYFLMYIFFLYFFPKPNFFLIIYRTPEQIHQNKKELSHKKITQINKSLKNLFHSNKNKFKVIYNKNPTKTLNNILKILFKQ